MHDVGITLGWLALQVTAVGIVALVAYPLAARRGPRAGAGVAAAFLTLSIGLTALAFCPLPGWWTCDPIGKEPGIAQASPPETNDGGLPSASKATSPQMESSRRHSGQTKVSSLSWLRAAFGTLGSMTAASTSRARSWPAGVAAVVVAGIAVCVLRLLLGLWAVGLWRRRGRLITAPDLLRQVDDLRAAMGCAQPVELRQCADLTGPATVGWRRPMLLLPTDWRTWDDGQLRAVLAHELAHVRRDDYRTALVARIGTALHFYHPLVHWLAGRLHVQQELAADALGARFAGGRLPYLRALAQLALRQEGRRISWPARAFLPARGTLLRRIAMLQARDGALDRPLGKAARTTAVVGLVLVTLGVSTLRGTGRAAAPPTAPAAATHTAPTAVRAPFDLTYLSEHDNGWFACRPAEMFCLPGMKSKADFINREVLTKAFDALGMKGGLGLKVEDLDQVVLGMRLIPDTKKPGCHGALIHRLALARAAKPFDWAARIKKWSPEVEAITYRGVVYYKMPLHELTMQVFGSAYLYVPDDRTLVTATDTDIQRFIRKEAYPTAGRVPAEEWKETEHSLLAFGFDNRDHTWADRLDQDEPPGPALKPLFVSATHFVGALDDADGVTARVLARTADPAATRAVTSGFQLALDMGRSAIEARLKTKLDRASAQALGVMQQFMQSAAVGHRNSAVRVELKARTDLSGLLDAFYVADP